MKFKRFLFIFILATFFVLLTTSIGTVSTKAAGDSPQYESVNPGDRYTYGMKRLKEKFHLSIYFLSSSKKSDYYLRLCNARLAELKYIVDKKDEENFEVATNRYFTTVGDYANFLKSKGTIEQKTKATENLNNHKPILEKLRDTFDPSTAQYRFLQDDINYLDIYIKSL